MVEQSAAHKSGRDRTRGAISLGTRHAGWHDGPPDIPACGPEQGHRYTHACSSNSKAKPLRKLLEVEVLLRSVGNSCTTGGRNPSP